MIQAYSFPRYLAAKKSVDDRALNRHVWNTLTDELPEGSPNHPVRALEIGAGIGTMIERALEWDLFTHTEYTAIDAQAENIATAGRRTPKWAHQNGWQVGDKPGGELNFHKDGRSLRVQLECTDLFDFLPGAGARPGWDLIIAHAFLDLIDIPATLPQIFKLLNANGVFYFSINFDGATLFEPVIEEAMDEKIQALYHRTMDERRVNGKPSGDSRAGRRLFQHIRAAGGKILDAGSSDWVVFPGPNGYPADEAYFLHFIIQTIQDALNGHPELEPAEFTDWVAERHAQIKRRELIYIAHQLDFVGRVDPGTSHSSMNGS
jgi:SAM-dependent methyltransferase